MGKISHTLLAYLRCLKGGAETMGLLCETVIFVLYKKEKMRSGNDSFFHFSLELVTRHYSL
jgi:hypothetical protein